MNSPTAIPFSLKKISYFYIIAGVVYLSLTTSAKAQSSPVNINFNNLPTGVEVRSQYPDVTFSSSGATITATAPAYDTASYPNLLTRKDSFGSNLFADLYVDFRQPVNNLTFKVIGVHNFHTAASVTYYVNGAVYGTYNVPGCGGAYCDITMTPASLGINNITRVEIRNINDLYGIDFDDFNYTPADVQGISITNPRVSENLNNTTQNALLAADVRLQTTVTPSGLTGGTYSWNITGPSQVVAGALNQSALTVRWTQPGIYTARANYTRNRVTVSGTVTVNVTLPSLTSFTAVQHETLLGRTRGCADTTNEFLWTLGCAPIQDGINFSASVQIPTATYLTDPAQTGIKYVQAVSTVRKIRFASGQVECFTGRASENNINSGWRLDSFSPVDGDPYDPSAVRFFSQGTTLTIVTDDSPAQGFNIHDAVKVDDRFQMYVVYFVGGNASAPSYQQRLGSLTWNWGGQLVYDAITPEFSSVPYSIQSYYADKMGMSRQKDPVASTVIYQGRNSDLVFTRCPGDPPPPQNQIDGSRFFVRQQYLDLFNREPDQGGSDFWTTQITRCGFENGCIYGSNGDYGKRTLVAREFFNSAEFQYTDPEMANPPGSPGFNPSIYNPAFVRHCYRGYLRREPDQGGLNFWVDLLNRTGDYNGMIYAFIASGEYRQRFGPP